MHRAVHVFGGNENIARGFRRFGGGDVFVCEVDCGVGREKCEAFFVARENAFVQRGAGKGIQAVVIIEFALRRKTGEQRKERFAVVRRHAGMAAQSFRRGGFRRR